MPDLSKIYLYRITHIRNIPHILQHGITPTNPANIVYLVSSVQKIIDHNPEFIFTDGHAVDSFSKQYTPKEIENIYKLLDKKAIKAKYWKDENDLDLKRRKEAEFLVLGDIAPSAVLGYLVYNQSAKEKMLTFGVEQKHVHIKPDFYF